MFGNDQRMLAQAQSAQASAMYQNAANAHAPRELRVLERIDGIRSGLLEINGRLSGFLSRLNNAPPAPGSASDATPPIGLIGMIEQSEQAIRENIDLLIKLNDAF
jgi:hypothetical protein